MIIEPLQSLLQAVLMIQQGRWSVAHKHEVTYYTQSSLLDMCNTGRDDWWTIDYQELVNISNFSADLVFSVIFFTFLCFMKVKASLTIWIQRRSIDRSRETHFPQNVVRPPNTKRMFFFRIQRMWSSQPVWRVGGQSSCVAFEECWLTLPVSCPFRKQQGLTPGCRGRSTFLSWGWKLLSRIPRDGYS